MKKKKREERNSTEMRGQSVFHKDFYQTFAMVWAIVPPASTSLSPESALVAAEHVLLQVKATVVNLLHNGQRWKEGIKKHVSHKVAVKNCKKKYKPIISTKKLYRTQQWTPWTPIKILNMLMELWIKISWILEDGQCSVDYRHNQ